MEFGDVWHPVRLDLDLLAERKSQLWRLAERAGRDPQEIGIAMREPLKIVSDSTPSSNELRLLGPVKKVIDNVAVLRDAGVGYLVLDTFYGTPELHGETVDSILATMERFATEVMPQFPEQ